MVHLNEKIKNNRVIRKLYYLTRANVNKKILVEHAEKTLNSFNVSFNNDQEKLDQIKDMIYMNSHYGFEFYEFILYDFKHKTLEQRLEFIADWEHLGFACCLNDHKNDSLFDDKWKTYSKFKKYYGREVLLCNNAEEFAEFANKHKTFILKPLNLSCGRGVEIIKFDDFSGTAQQLFDELIKKYNGYFLVEELIVQDNEMAKFHPSSVNTIRVPTIRMDDDTVVFHPFMRIGQGGKVVDNGGAGCLF